MSSILLICEKIKTRWPSDCSFGDNLSKRTNLPAALIKLSNASVRLVPWGETAASQPWRKHYFGNIEERKKKNRKFGSQS